MTRPPDDFDRDDEYEFEDDDFEESGFSEPGSDESDFDEPGFAEEQFPTEAPPLSRGPNPLRPDPPLFAPVVFDDDEEEDRGFRPAAATYQSDAGLLRVLGIIAVLGVVILALVLPWSPISVVGGDDDGDFPSEARDLPAVPDGLTGLSRLFEIEVPAEYVGRSLSVEIPLQDSVEDGSNIAIYSWAGNSWERLAAAQLNEAGSVATGTIPARTAALSLAVLQRTALAHSLGLMVDGGQTPDPVGLQSASVVVVLAGRVLGDGDSGGTMDAEPTLLQPAVQAAGDTPVYLGISGDVNPRGILATEASITSHLDEVMQAVQANNVDGVYLDYQGVSAEQGAAFTSLATQLDGRLTQASKGLIVGVPAGASSGYDWVALQGAADALWVRAPLDPATYYDTVGTILSGAPGVDASRVSLILDRRSAVSHGAAPAEAITQLQALTIASAMNLNVDAIGPGSPVTMRTAFLGTGEAALHWDDTARAVSFTYQDNNLEHRVWIQNRYSFGFALEAASNAGFGGIAVASASADAAHPDVWEPVAQFVEQGAVSLLKPYGPYLTPCWEASDGQVEGQPACWTEEADTTAVVWRAPSTEGAYTVRLVVSDGTTFVAQEVLLRVGEEAPTAEPTEEPTEAPTEEPTEEPTETPTEEPTEEPTETATEEPTATETAEPTATDEPAGPAGNE